MRRSALLVLCIAGAAIAAAVAAPTASAHIGRATISCTQVHFSFTSFANGATVNETVKIDGNLVDSRQFTFSGSSASNDVPISVPSGTHTVTADADWNVEGGGHADVTQQLSGCGPPPFAVPSLCGGGQLRLDKGGTFSASVT
jgi:hypothetical protein